MTTSWLMEDLFYYKYHFLLPYLFIYKISNDKVDVAFKILTISSSVRIEKKFFIKEFITSYCISSPRITNLKRTFLKLVKFFEEDDLIEFNSKIIFNTKVYQINQ